ncbi:hypothetical protein G7Z17_g5006 [Cylindrodendrum hubeiense]|uniref:5'-3' DNA helicase ZGRF1-like N-terminal domain-containing protein n=1 Tax=Cylindrodendrum hubeiense TaxID=595255 RepID=A0A9P5L9F6_9HYPO|nr:hypothetical protein G7Z17_g5006 [Cylindrodendrum hubeiense]
MAGPSTNGTAPGSLPATATVLDFICLFTHDLKRKQKRWQDGVLKYHTFNKRIMVSDDRGHFIGDAHWQAETHLEPGDEFQLDRGSAIVQVSDCTGQREQDLTELLDKRARDVEKRRANAISRAPRSGIGGVSSPAQDPTSHFQLRHRPLNSLIGVSPRIGRAVISPHSPYEARQMAQTAEQPMPSEDPPPPKRRKQERSPPSKSYHARSLFGAALTLSPFMTSSPTSQSQVMRDRTNTKPKAPDHHLHLGDNRLDASKKSHSLPITPAVSSTPAPLSTGASFQSKRRTVVPPPPSTTKANTRRHDSIVGKDKQSSSSSLSNASAPQKMKDVAEPLPKEHNPAHSNPEPRTELRIRSKQRRGLLMVSEKHGRDRNIGKRPRTTAEKSVESQASLEPGHLEQGNEILTVEEPTRTCGQPPMQHGPIDTNQRQNEAVTNVIGAGLHVLEDNASNNSGLLVTLYSAPEVELESHQTQKTGPQDDASCMRADETSSLATKTRILRDRRTRKGVARQSPSDEELEATTLSSVPKATDRIPASRATNSGSSAPRITKMARKSVKSREIIGFVAQCDEPTMMARPVAAPTLVTNSIIGHPTVGNIGGGEAESQSHTDATPKPPPVQPDSIARVAQPRSTGPDDKSEAKPTPRLCNPATRGKKAAQREDAAGHLPQTMIQLDPVLPARVGAPKPAPSAKSSGLPGFSKANGGAWSRHAEDLLGMTRPAEKPSRR